MEYVFLAIFIISSTIHLYASKKSDKRLRAQTKGFILLALLGWYCCSAQDCSTMVIVAILTSWLGDVLLIPKGNKWFAAGGISFFVSHVCFALCYLPQISFAAIPSWAIIAAALVYFAIVCVLFKELRKFLPKQLFYPMFLYLLANGTMNCFALYQLISLPCAATWTVFIGAVLFFISDSTLFFVRFGKNKILKTHFVVMLTYIAAEFMIVQGLVMLSLG